MTRISKQFERLPWPAQILVLAGLGVLTALGQPPLFHWYASLLGLAALFAVFPAAPTSRRAALWLWAFATGYFAFSLRWIVEPFQVDAEIFGWMAPFALGLMAAGLALFWAAAGWGAFKLRQPFALVLTLGLAELARAYVLTGFPWAGLAQIWIGSPVDQSLRWIGPHGLGVMTLLFGLLLGTSAQKPIWRVGAAAALAMLCLGPAVMPPKEVPSSNKPVIRIVQPNAPQREKWHPEKWQIFFWRQIEASRDGDVPDLIVWPETAIPHLLNNAEPVLEKIEEAARGAPVILGAIRESGGSYFNSLAVIGDNSSESYDKHHLVPFGEYMPFPALFRNLGIRGLAERADGGYSSGSGPKIISVAGLRALPLICYEAVFPQHARLSGARPDLLLQITNDAWFGTYAGPQQHLAQARMRAIEQGLPLVRSANTGISAMIDARGRIVASLPLGEHGYVDALLPDQLVPSFYSRTGDWLIVLVLVLGFIGVRRLPPGLNAN